MKGMKTLTKSVLHLYKYQLRKQLIKTATNIFERNIPVATKTYLFHKNEQGHKDREL